MPNFRRLPLQLISVVELSTDGGGGGAYGGGTEKITSD